MVDRLEEQVEHGRRQRHAPHAQGVEEVLEPVREVGHPRQAEQAGQPLQGMNPAEGVVHVLRVVAPQGPPRVEPEEVARQRLHDLLRLGDELRERLLGRTIGHAARRS